MSRRTNILAKLRRRRAGLGRFVLALFTTACLSAGATPCFAMALGTSQPSDPSVAAHDPSGPSGHHHAHTAPAAAHVAAGHGTGPADAAHSSTGHCPHCPPWASLPAHSGGGPHQLCSAVDGASAKGPSSAPDVLEHALAPTRLEFLQPPLLRPPDTPLVHAAARACSQVALNVRYCVFLI